MTDSNASSLDVVTATKPKSVRLAVISMLIAAGAALVQAVNGLVERAAYASGLEEASKTVNHDQIVNLTGNLRGSVLFDAILGITAVILMAPLAGLVNARKRWARLISGVSAAAIVIGEVVMMASDGSSIKTGNFIRAADVPGGNLDTVEAMNRLIVPSWFVPLHYLSEFAVLVAVIIVLVNLFRSPTNEYFHAGHEKPSHAERTWAVSQVRGGEQFDG